jgi:hypothetical protein
MAAILYSALLHLTEEEAVVALAPEDQAVLVVELMVSRSGGNVGGWKYSSNYTKSRQQWRWRWIR